MQTTTMNISLPNTLKTFAHTQAKTGGFSNPSDYVRTLIRTDKINKQKNAERNKLNKMLIDGLNSSKSGNFSKSEMQDIRDEITQGVVAK